MKTKDKPIIYFHYCGKCKTRTMIDTSYLNQLIRGFDKNTRAYFDDMLLWINHKKNHIEVSIM